MVKLVYKDNGKAGATTDLKKILEISKHDYLWLDLLDINDTEKKSLEDKFNVKLDLLSKKKVRHSFRFIESEDQIKINTRLLHHDGEKLIGKPILFVLMNEFLISNHSIPHLSYDDIYMDIELSNTALLNGKKVLLKILGKILEYDIDTIEDITNGIVKLSKSITTESNLDEDMIYEITSLQEQLILVRRNIIDKERVIISIAKSDLFLKKGLQKQISILEKDLHSILDYISFDFERLEYLQDTLMGLINLRQNIIMKIFTIVSVIFLPPTLIASIYGMNFQDMPELKFPYAYPIALSAMAVLSLMALYYFKRKKWI